jgi:hypothetical protein
MGIDWGTVELSLAGYPGDPRDWRVAPIGHQQGDVMDLVVLASDSHTLDGCDRVVLHGGQVIVQGKPIAAYPEGAALRVPPGEALNGISVEVFLAAARELERRLGQS